ncbi:hypothetical protein ADUPG1_004396, partial [Aduncisulcus paluster]
YDTVEGTEIVLECSGKEYQDHIKWVEERHQVVQRQVTKIAVMLSFRTGRVVQQENPSPQRKEGEEDRVINNNPEEREEHPGTHEDLSEEKWWLNEEEEKRLRDTRALEEAQEVEVSEETDPEESSESEQVPPETESAKV